jgi:LacI family transcriptional regulator
MKTPRIAILVDTATGWGRRMVRGVLDYAVQYGPWDIFIEPKGQNEAFTVPQKVDVDGIIARVSTPTMAAELESSRLPMVNVSGLQMKECHFPRVTSDWEAAAELAVQHFRERGLQHFAYIGPVHIPHVRQHKQFFEEALSKAGMECRVFQPGIKPSSPPSWPPSEEQLIPWFFNDTATTEIYTWGFQIGRDIISACRKAEIPVPHDAAVLGGDYDELLSDASHPALSGVLVPAQKIGYQAAATLHRMMKGEPAPKNPVLIRPEEIEERLSTDMLAVDDPQTLQALTYLRAHACEGIQVEDILKEVPMGRRALERRFRNVLGRSPAQEMRRIRINQARRLLSRTNLPMQDIAEACGYASYNYLGPIFKKETGLSPARYRNLTRGHQNPLRPTEHPAAPKV